MTRLFLLIALTVSLAACGGNNGNLQGTGSGADDYRKSPCASAEGGPCGPYQIFPRA